MADEKPAPKKPWGTPAQLEAFEKGPGFAKAQREAEKAVKVGRSAVIFAETVKHELGEGAPHGELAITRAEARQTAAIERVTAEIEFNEQHGRKIADLLATLTRGLDNQRKLREAREAATAARRHRASLPNRGEPVRPKQDRQHSLMTLLILCRSGALPFATPEIREAAGVLIGLIEAAQKTPRRTRPRLKDSQPKPRRPDDRQQR